MNMETMIIGLIGISAAVYLLRRGIKTLGGKPSCSCSGSSCCGDQCSGKDTISKN